MKMNNHSRNANPIPMPPPVANTLMQLQASYLHNNHSLPSSGNGVTTIPINHPVLQPASVINLTNSNDVVIGPMTQYQGSVTIYQYMDATVQRATSNNGHPHIGNSFVLSLIFFLYLMGLSKTCECMHVISFSSVDIVCKCICSEMTMCNP